ncbi:hypothetical protein BH20GEM1_BH20GEM1_09490 [soil metagenome]
MTGEWLSRALLLDPTAIPGDAACWADAREPGLARLPILFGWRRGGGPLVAGTSEGEATRDLWLAAASLADSTAEWTGDRWDGAFRAYWRRASPELRAALAERLPLPEDGWSLEAWSEAVWGSYASPVEPPAVAVVGSSLAPEVVESAAAPPGTGRTAAYTFELLDAERARIRCTLVSGHLDPDSSRKLPGELARSDRVGNGSSGGRDPAGPLEALERLARHSGATATWCRGEWVRYEGAGGAIRVFPAADGAWVQLAGADEGALAGLRYRHGLPLDPGGRPGAPPGAHLFLPGGVALTDSIEGLVRQWLRGSG